MPKRGQRLPWRLTTTWAGGGIKTFTQAFPSEHAALTARRDRLRIANYRDNGAGEFVVTNRDDPSYVAPEPEHCPFCPLWGVMYVWQVETELCIDHAEVLEDLLNRGVAPRGTEFC